MKRGGRHVQTGDDSMSNVSYDGPPLDMTMQHISERPALRNRLDEEAEQVVYATDPEQSGEETTTIINAPGATETQQAILEIAALMDVEATKREVYDRVDAAGVDTSYSYVCKTVAEFEDALPTPVEDEEPAEGYDKDTVTDLQADILDVAIEMGRGTTQRQVHAECEARGIDCAQSYVSKTIRQHLRTERKYKPDDEERDWDDLTAKQQIGVNFWRQYEPEECEYKTDTDAVHAFVDGRDVGYSTVWQARERWPHIIEARQDAESKTESEEIEITFQKCEIDGVEDMNELQVSVQVLQRLVARDVMDAETALEEVELLVAEVAR